MAESIFVVLEARNTTTTVPFMGKDENKKTISIPHTIPNSLFPTDEEFESSEKLIAWATETNCLFEMLQKGVGKALIEVRAKFKAPKKGKDNAPDTWDADYGQAQVDKMEWKAVTRPNQAGSKNIAETLLKENLATYQMMIDVANMTEEQLTPVLLKKYNQETDIVQGIINALNF